MALPVQGTGMCPAEQAYQYIALYLFYNRVPGPNIIFFSHFQKIDFFFRTNATKPPSRRALVFPSREHSAMPEWRPS